MAWEEFGGWKGKLRERCEVTYTIWEKSRAWKCGKYPLFDIVWNCQIDRQPSVTVRYIIIYTCMCATVDGFSVLPPSAVTVNPPSPLFTFHSLLPFPLFSYSFTFPYFVKNNLQITALARLTFLCFYGTIYTTKAAVYITQAPFMGHGGYHDKICTVRLQRRRTR